jgi:hypothetical protein
VGHWLGLYHTFQVSLVGSSSSRLELGDAQLLWDYAQLGWKWCLAAFLVRRTYEYQKLSQAALSLWVSGHEDVQSTATCAALCLTMCCLFCCIRALPTGWLQQSTRFWRRLDF